MATDRIAFIDGYGKKIKDYMQTNFEVKLRFAPNEKFYQTKSQRFPINLDAPVLTLSHNFAFKNFLGSKYSYNHTEFGIQKRFWFSAFGYFDAIVKAGKVWDKVPFPMLILPNANLSYTIQRPVCVVGFYLLCKRSFVQSYPSIEIYEIERGVCVQRFVR